MLSPRFDICHATYAHGSGIMEEEPEGEREATPETSEDVAAHCTHEQLTVAMTARPTQAQAT